MGPTTTTGMSSIREAMKSSGVSDQVLELIMSSWSKSTLKKYATPLNRWMAHCSENSIDPFMAAHEQGMEFLAEQFHQHNLGYSAMNTTRSAMSAVMQTVDGISFGKHPLVSRVMKGVFKQRPSLPKYTVTYDVAILLNYMTTMPPNKLATLMCLLSGQRAQTLGSLRLEFMHLDTDQCIFYISSLMKQSRPTFHPEPLKFLSFPDNTNICVVECINDYLERTRGLREEMESGGLFISYASPYKTIKSRSISRYVCKFLELAGIDTKTFTGHSTRSAATSAAAEKGLSLSEINKAAGWSNSKTFQRHYNIHIEKNFGKTVNSSLV